jgi:lysyl-tRNA synthetase class 2
MPVWWEPKRFADKRLRLETRARIVRAVRGYFENQTFIEVETPALQVSPGMEPHLKALATALHEPFGGPLNGPLNGQSSLYLHTSPEFAMKKLIVAGMPRLFQLAHAFRDGERSDLHHPEFTMLEWYRAGYGTAAIVEDCAGVVRGAAKAAEVQLFQHNGVTCDPFAEWERLSVVDAFMRDAGIDLLSVLGTSVLGPPGDGPGNSKDDPDPAPIKAEARRIGINCEDRDRFEDVFFRILLARIEPNLGRDRPTVLYDYPLCLSALAKAKARDPRLADRFEIYVCGVELANGCVELTDAAEHRRRFARDIAIKQRLYGVQYPADEDFLAALDRGLPDCAGVALGFDRLVMLATGANSIEDVLWAPVAGGN